MSINAQEQELLALLDGDLAALQLIQKAIADYQTVRALKRSGVAFMNETPKATTKDANDLHHALLTIQKLILRDAKAWENFTMSAKQAGFSRSIGLLIETIGPLVHIAKIDADDTAGLVKPGRKNEPEVIARWMILLAVWKALPAVADKKQRREIAFKAYELANIIDPTPQTNGGEPRGTEILRNDLKDRFVKDMLSRLVGIEPKSAIYHP